MFIKFDEMELFEFFESEPTIIGDYEEGNWLYSYKRNNFEVVLLILTYEMYVDISITYNESLIYSQKHNNILEIRKSSSDKLRIITIEENAIIIKKEPQIGVIVE